MKVCKNNNNMRHELLITENKKIKEYAAQRKCNTEQTMFFEESNAYKYTTAVDFQFELYTCLDKTCPCLG